jgi:guanylate kinase
MNVTIEIHYIAASKVSQTSSFQLRGRKPEAVALDLWRNIKKEMSYHAHLDKIILNGDQDITEAVKELEEQMWRKRMEDNLPF